MAIKSFKDKEAEKVFGGYFSRNLPQLIQQRARETLKQLDAAGNLNDLLLPPSNLLEQLQDDRKGQHSIRINQKYRVCFCWKNGKAHEVEIVDYH